ncbi:MAG: peptidylprolyl isomerase [Puniceicoccaceae bacterium]
MRKFLIVMALVAGIALMSGCRNKKELVLYGPGDTKAWETVDTAAQVEYAESLRKVELDTSAGKIVIVLYEDRAPVGVANFMQYVEDAFYNGTVFHRIVPGFVIQGGGFTADLNEKQTREPISNEAGNGLRNNRGTLSYARTMDVNSATSQFFINLADNPALNGDGVNDGYAVFGRVTQGMDVVDSIAQVETTNSGGMQGVPVNPVVILSAKEIQ